MALSPTQLSNAGKSTTAVMKRKALDDPSVKAQPTKKARNTRTKNAVKARRANPQTGSKLLSSFPVEILDKIFGDDALNQRDHLALSGTCALLRLGYNDDVWKGLSTVEKLAQTHNAFTQKLVHDPCDSEKSTTLSLSSALTPLSVPLHRIWTRALTRAADADVKPGIEFKSRKAVSMGKNHTKVITAVNQKRTLWGSLVFNYRDLAKLVDYHSFKSLEKVRSDGRVEQLYCLASVDAAILAKAGGPWKTRDILNGCKDKGRKRFKRDTPPPEGSLPRRGRKYVFPVGPLFDPYDSFDDDDDECGCIGCSYFSHYRSILDGMYFDEDDEEDGYDDEEDDECAVC